MFLNEDQRLLLKRESKVILGPHASNLWLLTLVLTATFFAIAFSAGSTDYLDDKMNDPFTNWVNIDLNGADDEAVSSLKLVVEDETVKSRFGYDGVQTEVNSSLNLVDKNGMSRLFSTLFYENLTSDLITAVLSEDNVVEGCSISTDSLSDASLGIVMTADALTHLGYEDKQWPAYVDYHSKSVDADTLGIAMLDDGIYSRAPLPLLAIVKRLPMNKEAIASKYLNEVRIKAGIDCPIDLNHENYARELFYFVPAEVEGFSSDSLKSVIPASLARYIDEVLPQPQTMDKLRPWKKGSIKRIYFSPGTPLDVVNRIEHEVSARFVSKGAERIYNYDTMELPGYTIRDNVISTHFTTLDSISGFEHFVKDVSGLQIEMTQVNAKKNFWAVSEMAGILTAAMIIFSIVSIIIFIVNMMHNYFQKVKRNLGTFKAFGVSDSGLIIVYTVMISAIVAVALLMTLILVWVVTLILPLREGNYPYLILWNPMTGWAILIISVSVIACILIVMRRLLRSTPGDLIYDR